MALKATPGMKDILSPEVSLWQQVEETAREIFLLYNYQEIRTPLLEATDLFVRGIGSETGVVQKEMYTFLDKGGDSVTLRPEGTASVVRAYIEHNLDKQDPTAKLYYMGPMFRYERPQKGRLRQFHQVGAELIGPSSPLADVEVIFMLDQLVRKLGITVFETQINSLGCSECRPPFQVKLTRFLESKKDLLCDQCQNRLQKNPLRVFDCKNARCIEQLKEAPLLLGELCASCHQHFESVQGGLKGAGVPFMVNPRIARGLDYYQRTAFELISNQLGAQNAFAGGGRYDGLIKDLGGADIPGIGFAIGIERVILLLSQTQGEKQVSSKKVYVAFMGGAGHCKAVGIARDLRHAGISCELDYDEKSLKSQLRRADKLQCSHVIIIGDTEVQTGKAQVKNFTAKTQEEVSLSDLVRYLSR